MHYFSRHFCYIPSVAVACDNYYQLYHVYIHRYDDWVERRGRGDDTDIAKALLAAAKANHVKIVDIILRKDDDVVKDAKDSVLQVKINGMPTWKMAVVEELSCIFEV